MVLCPNIHKATIRRAVFLTLTVFALPLHISAQSTLSQNQDGFSGETMDGFMNMDPPKDSTVIERIVSKEYSQWTIDSSTGQPVEIKPDSLHHMFQNVHLTEGMTGSYSHLGNMGSPRESRLFFERKPYPEFIFEAPYDFWIKQPTDFRFTDAKTPMVSIDYYKGGNKRTGEERIKGFFAANFNRMTGIGLDMDYLIGRGRYASQSTSFFDTRLYTYHRRDKYSIYITANRDKMKVTENGGIQNPYYITNPEAMAEGRKQYSAEDIPFRLYYNWNNLDRYQGLINHSLLISRTEYRTDSIADTVITRRREIEFAKMAHTVEVGSLQKQYITWQLPELYYERTFLNNDSIDRAKNFYLTNTLSLSLLEGSSKWAVAGLSAFARYEYMRFAMPDTLGGSWAKEYMRRYNQGNLTVGGKMEKRTGENLTFDATAETVLLGNRIGDVNIEGGLQLKHRLLGKEAKIGGRASFRAQKPAFFMNRYHSTFSWWDNDFKKEVRTHIGGWLDIEKTGTRLQVDVENISGYVYLENTGIGYEYGGGLELPAYNITSKQDNGSIQVVSAQLQQNFKLGPLHWDNTVTWQLSGNQNIIPLPALNIFTNLYFKFIYYKRLHMEIGAAGTYFSRYQAKSYCPAVGMYHLQSRECIREVGGYPLLTGYVNCYLRGVRFYVMYYHANDGLMNNRDSFIVPGYPANPGMLKFGLSWPLFD